MLIPSSVRLFVAGAPTDLRKGHPSLAVLVGSMVQEHPLCGHVFLFYNRRRNGLKAL
jgi:transposase